MISVPKIPPSMARRYCQKVFENKFVVELTIQQSSFKIRSQVLNNRVKIHQKGSSFRATDQKLKILRDRVLHFARSSFTFCAIEFYILRDRVLHFARSSFTFCAIEFYSLRDRVLCFARSSFTLSQ